MHISWPYHWQWLALVVMVITLNRAQATRKASCNGWTLKAPKEGDFICNPMGVTVSLPGTRCMLECDAGYRAKQEVLVCTETGGWVPTNTPECEPDTTMTLVIVFSIVGSIILVLGISFIYARTTKRCRGSRRKLEEDDPEAALRRKEVTDTSTYYGRVKRLKRKRRLQAERQRQKTAVKSAQGQKTVTKQPRGQSKKIEVKVREKMKTPPRSQGGRVREKKTVRPDKSKTPTKKAETNKKTKKPTITQNFTQSMQDFFCFICNACDGKGNAPKKVVGRKPGKDDVKVISISNDIPRSFPKKPISSSSASSSSSSSTSSESDSTSDSSSSYSSSSEDEESPPKKVGKKSITEGQSTKGKAGESKKKLDDSATPASRAKKAPQKPPPPKKKIPPPRPAPPKLISKTDKVSSEMNNSSESNASRHHSAGDARPDGRQQVPAGISSGYSSDGDRHRRKRGHSDSAMEGGRPQAPKSHRARHAEKDTGNSNSKRMEILSPGVDRSQPVTGNPYDNYPAALSYRQYQNFENDYRRTTGDYHPQYSLVQIIPLSKTKKNKREYREEEESSSQEEENVPKIDKSKSVQGGMKYICISEKEEESESDEEYNEKRNHKIRRHQRQRYEGPSERDRRRHSPDIIHKARPAKAQKKSEKPKRSESSAKRQRKREIEDETIIDDGHSTKRRQDERAGKSHHKKKHHHQKRDKHKSRHERSGHKNSENSKRKDKEK